MSIDLSIIIPIYNEADNLPDVIEAINTFCKENTLQIEVIWVDDGSQDNSVSILQSAKYRLYHAKLLVLAKNFGVHAALRAGVSRANGTFITFLYADLQDNPQVILKMLERAWQNKLDIVWAEREKASNLTSKIYAWVIRKWAIKHFPKNGFDMILFNKKVQSHLNQHVEANSSIFLQILSLGFRQGGVRYEKEARKKGKSKWSLTQKVKLFADSLIAFSYAPIRFVTFMGIFMALLGLGFATYLVLRKLLYDDLLQGWTMLVSILMLGFGITNISLGIIAEYLWRTLDASRGRAVFVIEKEEVIASISQ